MSNRDYVLGTTDQELARLGLQHQLWSGQAYSIWERAQFGLGSHLLDAGCGPGFGTADLSALVGPRGKITAVDVSEKYIQRVKALDLANVEARVADLMNDGNALPRDAFDGAYCRWVLCFLSEPQRLIDNVAAALKPGGRFAIQDYVNYRAFKLAPKSEAFERMVQAVGDSFQIHGGGDCDIGCRLPTLLDRAGLRVTYIAPILRIARPSDPLWQWPDSFFRIYAHTLVTMGLITEAQRLEFERVWTDRASDPNAFFTSPPLIEIVAVKR